MFKNVITFILLSIGLITFGQNEVNNYKYVIVPKSFDFTKGEDQYQLNSIAKFLFNKYGFIAYFEGEDYPKDLRLNSCLALEADVYEVKGGFLKTKLEIALKNCNDKIVVTSKVGESKLKNYGKAYNQALRDAFITFKNSNYKYTPVNDADIELTAVSPSENETISEPLERATNPKIDQQELVANFNSETIYYAQPIENGYQLIDSEPKIIMILLKTSAPDIFMVKDKNAMVIKKNNQWLFTENQGDKLIEKRLNIKF
ncbi:hypothetical protein [uncultured Winogradskyella sp.]|uniref:hypothetical protein n=1 Tax=uncultured Winogradskyella sp. TaxID=395353 RepID=UPI002615880F|nr:hypothetical protein [uncultured Winogradskyella sp.]